MKKFVTKLATILLVVLLLPTETAGAGTFSDLSENHTNYDAILYLQENGVLNGYSDGTFRPDQTVNRAEFLKIILEGSDIALDISTDTPFTDINHNEWYGPYVKKAFHESWINGYSDGTFRPNQTINKVEALKILAVVQGWQLATPTTQPFTDTTLDAWYTPYISYAKEHGYLEESGNYFSPAVNMSRAKISEVIYRTIATIEPIVEENITPTPSSEVEPKITLELEPEPTIDIAPEPIEEAYKNLNFTPEAFNEIESTFFSGISLDETLPNIFYKNEVYTVSGTTSNNDQEVTVILEGITDKNFYKTFSAKIKNGKIEVPVHFSEEGNYKLGIIPGTSGTSKAIAISIVPNLPDKNDKTATPTTINDFEIGFSDDKTFVGFSAPPSTLKKITFIQDSKNVTYYSRQDFDSLTIDYKDFENFDEKNTTYQIQLASISDDKPLQINSDFSNTNSKTFTAIEHSFSDIEDTFNATVPELMPSISPINFSGTINAETSTEAYVIKPDGHVDKLALTTTSTTSTYLGGTTINSSGNFTFNYTPLTNGRYILEINDKFGLPILNHPVYIGGAIPLIPDYLDLNERKFFEGTINLENFRTELLNLINNSRQEHGLNPVELSTEINVVAQNHAQDMANNNYFAHVNLAGQTPDDRRLAAGITTAVGENIAKDTSILFGHHGLMRSAAHRSNILTPSWTRVGLGIAETEGHLIIAEEFSTNAVTTSDLVNFKNELYTGINNIRTSPLTTTTALESASNYLNNKEIIENLELTNQMFTDALNTYSITGNSNAIGRSFNIWSQILDSILTDEASVLNQGTWQSMGADIQLDATGIIHTILILNSNT